jgi:hypothetical protein
MCIWKVVGFVVSVATCISGCDLLGLGSSKDQETPDLTAPGDVIEVACVAANQSIELRWTEPTDVDLAGIEIVCSNAGINNEFVPAGTTSFGFDNLENGTEYAFLLQTRDTTGNSSFGITVSNAPFDTTSRIRIRGSFSTRRQQALGDGVRALASVEDYSIVIVYDPQINAYSSFMAEMATSPSFSFIEHEAVALAADGSFSHEIDKGKSFACFLVDNTQAIRKVVGIVGVGTADEGTWELMSADILEGEVYFGTIPMSTVDSVLVVGANIEDLNLSVDDTAIVEQLARFDDTIRFLENFINNNYEYIVVPAFWSPSLRPLADLGADEWLDPYQISYAGYGVVVCTTVDIGEIQVVPPAEVQVAGGSTYDPTTPYLTVLGAPIWVQDYYATNLFWGEGNLLQAPTHPGYWQVIDATDELRAELRIDASGFEDVSKVRAPLPLVRLNENDAPGYVTDVDISWVIYDGADFGNVSTEIISAVGFGTIEVNIGDTTGQETFEVPFEESINIYLSTPVLRDANFVLGVQYMYNACYFGFPYFPYP